MSAKRKDKKGRVLRTGESQRKDGRYAFKYIDATGKPQFVYSWKLEKTDKLPTGKRDDLSLRELACKRFGKRHTRVCGARHAHRLIHIGASGERVSDTSA